MAFLKVKKNRLNHFEFLKKKSNLIPLIRFHYILINYNYKKKAHLNILLIFSNEIL